MSVKTFRDISSVETSKGSVYQFLPDGKTQRFKKLTGELLLPQDALVFIPPYEVMQTILSPKELVQKLLVGHKDGYYKRLLQYVGGGDRNIYFVGGNEANASFFSKDQPFLRSNEEIANLTQSVFAAFTSEDGYLTDFVIEVSKEPVLGYFTLDKRFEPPRQIHLGNQVVKIVYKDGSISQI